MTSAYEHGTAILCTTSWWTQTRDIRTTLRYRATCYTACAVLQHNAIDPCLLGPALTYGLNIVIRITGLSCCAGQRSTVRQRCSDCSRCSHLTSLRPCNLHWRRLPRESTAHTTYTSLLFKMRLVQTARRMIILFGIPDGRPFHGGCEFGYDSIG